MNLKIVSSIIGATLLLSGCSMSAEPEPGVSPVEPSESQSTTEPTSLVDIISTSGEFSLTLQELTTPETKLNVDLTLNETYAAYSISKTELDSEELLAKIKEVSPQDTRESNSFVSENPFSLNGIRSWCTVYPAGEAIDESLLKEVSNADAENLLKDVLKDMSENVTNYKFYHESEGPFRYSSAIRIVDGLETPVEFSATFINGVIVQLCGYDYQMTKITDSKTVDSATLSERSVDAQYVGVASKNKQNLSAQYLMAYGPETSYLVIGTKIANGDTALPVIAISNDDFKFSQPVIE